MVIRAGLEPRISALKGLRPDHLDERTILAGSFPVAVPDIFLGTNAFVICRPLSLAQLASSAAGSARIALPALSCCSDKNIINQHIEQCGKND